MKTMALFCLAAVLVSCQRTPAPVPPSSEFGLVLLGFYDSHKVNWVKNDQIVFNKINDKDQTIGQQKSVLFVGNKEAWGLFYPDKLIVEGDNRIRILYPDNTTDLLELKNVKLSRDGMSQAEVYLNSSKLMPDADSNSTLTVYGLK